MSRRSVLVAALAALLIPAAAALSACGDDGDSAAPAPDPAELVGKTFVAESVSGTEIPGGGPLEVVFPEAGRISATAGCNRHMGPVSFDGDTLTAGDLASTMMACAGPAAGADAWLSALFAEPLTWARTALAAGDTTGPADGLLLQRGELKISLVERADSPLVGPEWTLRSLVRNTGVESSRAIEQANAHLSFTAEGTVTGSAGCNRLNGTATVVGDRIEFGPLATTRMACPADITDVENAVLAVLDGPVTFTVDGPELALTNVADPSIGLRLTTD